MRTVWTAPYRLQICSFSPAYRWALETGRFWVGCRSCMPRSPLQSVAILIRHEWYPNYPSVLSCWREVTIYQVLMNNSYLFANHPLPNRIYQGQQNLAHIGGRLKLTPSAPCQLCVQQQWATFWQPWPKLWLSLILQAYLTGTSGSLTSQTTSSLPAPVPPPAVTRRLWVNITRSWQ